jgi:hypothetical protein
MPVDVFGAYFYARATKKMLTKIRKRAGFEGIYFKI